jgi:hypothetical protein
LGISFAGQAFSTQGVTEGISSVLAQWHAKSVRPEQPSEVRAVTKQFKAHWGSLSNCAEAVAARAMATAATENFMLIDEVG